jgi:hypothetical protein
MSSMEEDQMHVTDQASSRRPYVKDNETRLYVRVFKLNAPPYL